MLITPVLARLDWTAVSKTQLGAARELNVSQSTISRYLRGITPIPTFRQTSIYQAYERVQYEQYRVRGLSPYSAARYRGLTPETTDMWLNRLDRTVDKFSEGVAIKRAKKDGLDWGTMSYDDKEGYLEGAYDSVRAGLDKSEESIENIEEGIT